MKSPFSLGRNVAIASAIIALSTGTTQADLVGWWKFDEPSGTIAADSSSDGANHPGVLQNGANFVPAGGKFGGSVSLDGANDIVRIADHADFEFDANTSFSIAFWFKSSADFSNTRGFIGKGYENDPHVPGYYLVRAGGDDVPEFDSKQSTGSTPRMKFDGTGEITDGTWRHVVAVKDVNAGQARLYIDSGVPVTFPLSVIAGDWAMGVNGNDLIIGQYLDRWTQGEFDDVGIWNEALSAGDITTIFFSGIAGLAPPDSDFDGLVDAWELAFFGDLDQDGNGDFDFDGLTNIQEFNVGTDPTSADSDNDALTDSDEFNLFGTNPLSADTDNDSLADGDEIIVYLTSPIIADSDADGLNDGEEVGIHGTDPLKPDTDMDGFTDGVEVSASSDPLDENSKPDVTDLDDVVINEFMASNGATLLDEDGDTPDWIELWNPSGASSVSIGGWHLTDDPLDLTKWTVPATTLAANSFLVVFASGKDRALAGAELHTSFALQKNGGYLALTRPDGAGGTEIVHEINPYAEQFEDVSFGLYGTNSPLPSGYFTNPTPNAANDAGAVQGFVADTSFSVDRGLYNSAQSVIISSATPGASIIYTTDGTVPTGSPLNGTRVNAPNGSTPPAATVNVTTTTQLRAMALKADFEPTNVDTHTYVFPVDVLDQGTPSQSSASWGHTVRDWAMDPDVKNHASSQSRVVADDLMTIPTVSLSLPFADFWGSGGIYISGEGVPKNCSIEYFNPLGSPADPNTENGFQVDGTVQIAGGSSTGRWKTDKLSMRLKFGPDLQANVFDYPGVPFGEQAAKRFDTLVLDARLNNVWCHPSGGQQIKGQYVRDQYMADLQNSLGGTAPHGRHVHLYISGIYWGMHTLHERPDDNFAAEYLGGDNYDYDAIKHRSSTVLNGTNADYLALASLLGQNLSNQANYTAVTDKLDVEDFAKYMIVNYYGGNTDWSHQNWYASRNVVDPAGRWRFHSWDAEHVLKSAGENITGRDNGNSPTRYHNQLMGNSEYKLVFADIVRREFFNGGELTPAAARAKYDARIAMINEAIRCESARWGDNRKSVPYLRGAEWMNELNNLRNNYFPNRTNTVLSQFIGKTWYPATDAPNFAQHGGDVPDNFGLTISSPDGGTIYYTLDGSDPRQAFTANAVGTAYSGGVTLTETGTVKARVRSGGGEWSAMTEALFIVGAVEADSTNLVLSEIHYRPASPSAAEIAAGFGDRGEFEFAELFNVGPNPIDLTNVRFTAGLDFDFALHSSIPQLLPGERLVIVENSDAFEMRYGTGIPVAGEFQNGSQLANGGETLSLINTALPAGQQTVQSFIYDDKAPWPEAPDGDGYSLTLACDESNPDPALASSWRSSVAIGGSPGTGDGQTLADFLASHGLVLGDEALDGDHDGLTTLLEYALGTDPTDAASTAEVVISSGLFTVGSSVDEYATMRFPRSNSADGVELIPEVSTDLQTWADSAEVVDSHSAGLGVDMITFRSAIPTSVQARQFLRLTVRSK